MIFTIGHSTRSQEELLDLLTQFAVQTLVDVRTIPHSKRNPQFNKEEFAKALRATGIEYLHFPKLGGFRHPRRDSQNTGWRNQGFRGFADYMQTGEFDEGLSSLLQIASTGQVAIMCAEAAYWRCHRKLISDALLVRGIDVQHIISAGRTEPHTLTDFAKVDGSRITYPPQQPGLDL